MSNPQKNKTKQLKREISLLHDRLEQFKKRKRLLEKRLKQIGKMQNLSQNKLNKVTKMHGKSRDELEQIAKMKRIKSYKKCRRRVNHISFEIKNGLVELFNNNLDDDKISDIKKILNRLRDILTKEYRKKTKK